MTSMKNNDWKDRLNVVYSTNPDFGYEMDNDEEQVTFDKNKQNLRVSIDKKNRGGKVVTLITGFIGTENDLYKDSLIVKEVIFSFEFGVIAEIGSSVVVSISPLLARYSITSSVLLFNVEVEIPV